MAESLNILVMILVILGPIFILFYSMLIVTGMEVEATVVTYYKDKKMFYGAKFTYNNKEYIARIANYDSLNENDIVKIRTRIIGGIPLGAYVIG